MLCFLGASIFLAISYLKLFYAKKKSLVQTIKSRTSPCLHSELIERQENVSGLSPKWYLYYWYSWSQRMWLLPEENSFQDWKTELDRLNQLVLGPGLGHHRPLTQRQSFGWVQPGEPSSSAGWLAKGREGTELGSIRPVPRQTPHLHTVLLTL